MSVPVMTLGRAPARSVQPGELDEILGEFAERNIRPTRLNILRRAIEPGCPEEFAVAVADAAERTERVMI